MNEQQKIEELLKPRYKVTADWFNNTMPVGTILYRHPNLPDWCYVPQDGSAYAMIGLKESAIRKHKHLIREMGWWEDLPADQLPEYVSNIGRSIYGQVLSASSQNGGFILVCGEDVTQAHFSNYIPATKAEYDSHINSKK